MVAFGIFAGLLFLIMLAVLELNKNTILGFALLIAAQILFYLVAFAHAAVSFGRALIMV